MSDRLHLFGVRHHGPGSAASLEQALDALDPEQVLIEGPPDADEILSLAASAGMRPPVAILVHVADQPQTARFFPLAEFSPEWRAILWALRRGRPVRFIDLPASVDLAPPPDAEVEQPAGGEDEPRMDEARAPGDESEDGDADEQPVSRDPLSQLAEAAGHSDGESWWNALVESRAQAPEIFAGIETAMAAVREADTGDGIGDADRRARDELREAHMRLEIRKALKEGAGPVAVVTGAWHVPALRRAVPVGEDRALLSGRRKVKTVATWVPWTDTRLAFASGYGAGVISPGWYRHLWREFQSGGRDPSRLTARWQARAAEMLRGEGQLAATASVIEASRLAESLAALRGFAVPGLAEMQDASLAALCHGEPAPLDLIRTRLVLGETVGEIDEAVPQMPLAADLVRWQKQTRLKPEALEREIRLDLRSEAGLLKSTLLHRLVLIDVPWGTLTEAGGGRGTFRERWTLLWRPELSVKLAEALVWGTTIEQAAGNASVSRALSSGEIGEVAEIVRLCLLADLSAPAERCIARLQALAANASDIAGLMRAAAPLAGVLRYGTARRIPVEALTLLVTSLIEEVCVGLIHACRQLDAEATAAAREAMAGFDKAVGLMEEARLAEDWQRALAAVADDSGAEPLLAGFAVRRLYDRGVLDGGTASPYLSRALSPAVAPAAAGDWLEGFLAGGGQLLLHDAALLAVVDDWMLGLGEEDFVSLLPMLRRAFSSIDAMERRRLLLQVRDGPAPARPGGGDPDDGPSEAFERALPLLRTILGLEAA